MGNRHDVSYKSKFMDAVRLFRKRDEEKRVCFCFSFNISF